MNNVISFEAERNKREVANAEAQESHKGTAQPEDKKQYSLQETHFENGERAVETVDGQLLKFDYVDTRAIIASHEAVNKDREMKESKVVFEHITGDAHQTAHDHAVEHIDETAKRTIDLLSEQQSEPGANDVFGRTFRQFTTDHGSHSLFRLRSIPNWSWSETNEKDINASLKSGHVYLIPRELAQDFVTNLESQSSFGVANSNERTKGTLITGKARGGDSPEDKYMSIPVTLGSGEIVQIWLVFGETVESQQKDTDTESIESLSQLYESVGLTLVDISEMQPKEQMRFFLELVHSVISGFESISGDMAVDLMRTLAYTFCEELHVSAATKMLITDHIDEVAPQISGVQLENMSDKGGYWDGHSVKLATHLLLSEDSNLVRSVRLHEDYHKVNNHHYPIDNYEPDAVVFKIGGYFFTTRELVEGINTLDVDQQDLATYSSYQYRAYADKLLKAATASNKTNLEELRYGINVSHSVEELTDDGLLSDIATATSPQGIVIAEPSNPKRQKEGEEEPIGEMEREEALPEEQSTLAKRAA